MTGIRRFTERFVFAVMTLILWQYFSPWTIVVQRRAKSSEIRLPLEEPPSQNQSSVDSIQEKPRGKSSIAQVFGDLEKVFLKSTRQASTPPKISRDQSIEWIYNMKGHGDWLNLIESQDDHGLMTLTKLVQRYIFEKQNPRDCDAQKFLILRKFPGDDAFGLGAIIQRISDYLSIAIQTNSILLYAEDSPPGEHFISEPTDRESQTCGRTLNCIFQELSNCTSKEQRGIKTESQSTFSNGDVDLDVDLYLEKHRYPIPPLFEATLKSIQPDITEEMLKYWWRAQAAGYIMRLNEKSSARLKELRLGGTKQLGMQWDSNGHSEGVNVPFPLPEGTISIHVRHGDKGSEMRLVPFNDYVVRAEKFTAENPLGSWKRAFLSTEDPNVIEQMKTMARITPFSYSGSNSRWTWYWSDIPRLNTGPETQLKEFGNRTDLTIKWILQLVMAIECDVFVGTRGSGWNRLIDSLRCVWLASCKQSFLEVGFEDDWIGYGP